MAGLLAGWSARRASADSKRILTTRALRGFADGAVSILLPSYLTAIGFSAGQVGAIIFGTLLGSALLTLWVGFASRRIGRKRLLLAACGLMLATGLGFARFTAFWPVFVVAILGTFNPSAGDVSLFLPIEQAALAESVAVSDLTATFALYNIAGALGGALGALASGLPTAIASRTGLHAAATQRLGFLAYSAMAVMSAIVYRSLSPAVEAEASAANAAPLEKSRRIVLRLSALFSLDSFGGGFVVESLLALWLFKRFDLSVQAAGSFFFASRLLGSVSQFMSPALAARIGRINTMVYTHLPANLFLVLSAIMPNAGLALAFLLVRASLSQMDVPARQSYVMAVVPSEERAAAAGVTNVPRSLASALGPLPAGAMLDWTPFGWPLVCAGALKALYDVLLLVQFRRVKPSDERE